MSSWGSWRTKIVRFEYQQWICLGKFGICLDRRLSMWVSVGNSVLRAARKSRKVQWNSSGFSRSFRRRNSRSYRSWKCLEAVRCNPKCQRHRRIGSTSTCNSNWVRSGKRKMSSRFSSSRSRRSSRWFECNASKTKNSNCKKARNESRRLLLVVVGSGKKIPRKNLKNTQNTFKSRISTPISIMILMSMKFDCFWSKYPLY